MKRKSRKQSSRGFAKKISQITYKGQPYEVSAYSMGALYATAVDRIARLTNAPPSDVVASLHTDLALMVEEAKRSNEVKKLIENLSLSVGMKIVEEKWD